MKTKIELLDGIRKLCGYVENGTDTSVCIFQDDATREWVVSLGTGKKRRSYDAPTFEEAIALAMKEERVDEEG